MMYGEKARADTTNTNNRNERIENDIWEQAKRPYDKQNNPRINPIARYNKMTKRQKETLKQTPGQMDGNWLMKKARDGRPL